VDHSYAKGYGHYDANSCSGLHKNESRFMQCDNMPLLLGLWVCALHCNSDGVEMISSQILSSSCAMTGGPIVDLTSGHDRQESVLQACCM
jgi:hypothetical protein